MPTPNWVERSETSLNPISLACFDEFEAIFAISFPAMIRTVGTPM
jgi:hypothetical protein